MLPKTHIALGLAFTLLLAFFFPQIGIANLLLVFLASFLIDTDHYLAAVLYNDSWSIKRALSRYETVSRIIREKHSRGLREKEPHFHAFHTIEFHLLVLLLGLWWTPFMYIFIGMAFHSILDALSFINSGYLYIREYLLVRWIAKRIISLHKE